MDGKRNGKRNAGKVGSDEGREKKGETTEGG